MDDASHSEPAPSRTVAFLFTDLEGSTRLWERHPKAMKAAIARHDGILRDAVEASRGSVVKTMGDGLMAVLPTVGDGVRAAVEAQRALAAEPWGDLGALRVRMGLHAGVAHEADGDYFGRVVNRTARIMGVAHGGQVLVSGAAAELVRDDLPEDVSLRDLGEHRLKDLERAEHLCQVLHPDLPADFPPLVSLSERPNNLPTQTSVFIGRERELAEVRSQIESPETRLVTLLGPGGTGKTRLALQVAAEEVDRFVDGVFFVDLADARDVESVLISIIRSVGLQESAEETGVDDLARQLRGRSILLVLDNFEQVTAAATMLVELLEASPTLTVLVTSREALRVRGEHLLTIPPLGLPEAGDGAASAEMLARSEAVQLFVDRARAVRSDFALTDDNAAAVAALCARLDGLPLAIELAAARLNLFSPQNLLERLEQGTTVLRGGPRDLPARQQTLHDTIAWSDALLEPGDRLLFHLLSAFSGIGIEAAEGVVERLRPSLPADIDVIDGLSSLVDKSLLHRAEDVGGAPQFAMLRVIRDYAVARLDEYQDLAVAVRQAHAASFASFAREQWRGLSRRKRGEVLHELAAEADNLHLAWRHWVEAGDLGRLHELVDSLWLLYDGRGWHRASVDLTTDMLGVLSATPSTPERVTQEVTLLTSLARVLLGTKGYTEEVAEIYNRALDLAEANDLPELYPVLRGLASFYNSTSAYRERDEIGRRLLDLAEREGDRSMRLDGLVVAGTNAIFRNDIRGGLALLDESFELMDPEADMSRRFWFGAYPGIVGLVTSAMLNWLCGSVARAQELTGRALAIAEELGHPFTLAYATYHVGFLHLLWGELPVAIEQARRVREVAGTFDLTIWAALGDCLEGAAGVRLGDEEAFAQFEAGLRQYEGLTTPPIFMPLLLFIKAGLLGQGGAADEGLVVLQQAFEMNTATGGDEDAEAFLAPEFLLLQGDLLLGLSEPDEDQAAAAYEQALAIATEFDLEMTRLRAAIALCRLKEGERARDLVRSIYASFTEDVSAVPLVEARELLDAAS